MNKTAIIAISFFILKIASKYITLYLSIIKEYYLFQIIFFRD